MQHNSIVRRYLWTMLILGVGCSPGASEKADILVDLTLTPSPPVVGNTQMSLKLATSDGTPVDGAEVRLEGNMNHAGMKPSFAELQEAEPGRYLGRLNFTMGGDWFILVTAKTPDGQTVQQKVDVPGVKTR